MAAAHSSSSSTAIHVAICVLIIVRSRIMIHLATLTASLFIWIVGFAGAALVRASLPLRRMLGIPDVQLRLQLPAHCLLGSANCPPPLLIKRESVRAARHWRPWRERCRWATWGVRWVLRQWDTCRCLPPWAWEACTRRFRRDCGGGHHHLEAPGEIKGKNVLQSSNLLCANSKAMDQCISNRYIMYSDNRTCHGNVILHSAFRCKSYISVEKHHTQVLSKRAYIIKKAFESGDSDWASQMTCWYQFQILQGFCVSMARGPGPIACKSWRPGRPPTWTRAPTEASPLASVSACQLLQSPPPLSESETSRYSSEEHDHSDPGQC